jgi:3-deoxy-D-manno-octulosonate 8-phosphate phosphatase (KDO 8-P phosphatase)
MKQSSAAQKIKVVILDIDGVLTDGGISYGQGSAHENKSFYVKDGLGVVMLRRYGIRVGVLTGRSCLANRQRCTELQMDFIKENSNPKLPAFLELLAELEVSPEECLYIGDDLVDWPVMRRVGVSVAVGDAAPELKQRATLTTVAAGGRGAVREAAEWLLKQQGKWEQVLSFYEMS